MFHSTKINHYKISITYLPLGNQQKKYYLNYIKHRFTYLIILLCLSFSIKAQQVLFPPLNFQSHHLLSFSYSNFVSANQLMMLAPNNIFQKQLPPISLGSINDLPFFCAMECRFRKHTNIWIKLRAGDDASYMKMIKSSTK